MDDPVISPAAMARIRRIHRMSQRYNARTGTEHNERLLGLMEHHVAEIRELFAAGRDHFLVETGDLLILCFELLLENGAAPDTVLERCFGRYDRKLEELMDKLDEDASRSR